MRFYLGKFSNNYFNQLDNKFYECDNINKLNGIQEGDYAFIYPYPKGNSSEAIRLWRVQEIITDKARLELPSDTVKVIFEEIIDSTFQNIDFLIACKYFDLNTDLVVNSHMATKFAFLPLIIDPHFDSQNFFKTEFYNQDNLRKIKICDANSLINDRYNFQIYLYNGNFKCKEAEFGKMPGEFKDNRHLRGKGSPKKDRAFDAFEKHIQNSKEFSLVDFSIYSFYFCFFCDYVEKINYWVFQGNPEIYDVINAIKDNQLKSWTVRSHKDKIKLGDKFILWLTGKNSGCYAIGEITSNIYTAKLESDAIYYKNAQQNIETERVEVSIEKSYIDNPILADSIRNVRLFSSFKGGNQGTNFTATKDQYEYFSTNKNQSMKKYWLFAPGENANMWEDFYSLGIMGLGFEQIGDLNNYNSKEEIQAKFQEIEKTSGNKMNDTNANYQFKFEVSIGDIIIVKRGRSEYLGYGIVASDYYYDNSRLIYKKCRKVNWKKRGNWNEENKDIVLKTLTDITRYSDYVTKLINLIGIEKENMEANKITNSSLNQILYGAPGTGKTYTTKKLAVEIIDNIIYENRDEINRRYEELIHSNQIQFITFHQSMSYEDFIEGIKPITNDNQVTYEVMDGLFKKISYLASQEPIAYGESENNVNVLFEDAWDFLTQQVNSLSDSKFTLKSLTGTEIEITEISNQGNLILKPKVENGLEYTISFNRTKKLFDAFPNLESISNIDKEFRSVIGGSYSTGYWAVVNFLNNWRKENHKNNPSKSKKQSTKKFVLIIDEINRGNVSSIFGELITLIEEDKRKGILLPREETIEVVLPYSKDRFSVPDNLYIIGTMNTADRSVEALDTALRRRFSFVEMPSEYEVLKPESQLHKILWKYENTPWKSKEWNIIEEKINELLNFNDNWYSLKEKVWNNFKLENKATDIESLKSFITPHIDLANLLYTINSRIELLIDKNHQIGHAYFINVESFDDLVFVFKNKIIPLLEEYFYGDYGKIGLVLGSEFIKESSQSRSFAKFDYENAELLKEKKVWEFTNSSLWTVHSFQSIYA